MRKSLSGPWRKKWAGARFDSYAANAPIAYRLRMTCPSAIRTAIGVKGILTLPANFGSLN
jgi:hypothetical protein